MPEEYEINQLRARVTELENRLNFLYEKLNVSFITPAVQDDPRIIDQLQRKNLIEAIKIYRETNKVGLAEAKQAVEAIADRHSLR